MSTDAAISTFRFWLACPLAVTSSIPFSFTPKQLATYAASTTLVTFPAGPDYQVQLITQESPLSSLHALSLLNIPLNNLALQDVNVTIESVVTRTYRTCAFLG